MDFLAITALFSSYRSKVEKGVPGAALALPVFRKDAGTDPVQQEHPGLCQRCPCLRRPASDSDVSSVSMDKWRAHCSPFVLYFHAYYTEELWSGVLQKSPEFDSQN